MRLRPLPQPLPLFPADNWWNTDISTAPVDANSAAFIAFIDNGTDRRLQQDWGGAGDAAGLTYCIPYISVPGTQPRVPVTFVAYGDESDAGAPGDPPGYRFPTRRRVRLAGSKAVRPVQSMPPAIATCSSSIATVASCSSSIARTGTPG